MIQIPQFKVRRLEKEIIIGYINYLPINKIMKLHSLNRSCHTFNFLTHFKNLVTGSRYHGQTGCSQVPGPDWSNRVSSPSRGSPSESGTPQHGWNSQERFGAEERCRHSWRIGCTKFQARNQVQWGSKKERFGLGCYHRSIEQWYNYLPFEYVTSRVQ